MTAHPAPLQARHDIDAVARQVAVALLDKIADVDADPKVDLTVLGHSGVALDHRVPHFDGTTHGVDRAAELDDASVAWLTQQASVHPRRALAVKKMPSGETGETGRGRASIASGRIYQMT